MKFGPIHIIALVAMIIFLIFFARPLAHIFGINRQMDQWAQESIGDR
jgi:hypothetical protein